MPRSARGSVDPNAVTAVDEPRRPELDVFAVKAISRHHRHLTVLAVIALGGGLGSVARYLVSTAIPTRPGHFPWATFWINLSGCFALGLLMVFILDVWPPRRFVRPFAGVGFLGGYTTFSTFAVEVRNLAAHGAWTLADAYLLGTLVGGLAAGWCGIALARLIARLPVMRPSEGKSS